MSRAVRCAERNFRGLGYRKATSLGMHRGWWVDRLTFTFAVGFDRYFFTSCALDSRWSCWYLGLVPLFAI